MTDSAMGCVKQGQGQSHRLAETVVYGKLSAWACNAVPEGRTELGVDYMDSAAPVAAQQIQKAGVRLARVLNEALE